MATQTLAPGRRRRVHDTGAIVYEGTLETPTATAPGRYAFVVQFSSENGAALAANALWNEVHQDVATIVIEGAPVTINHSAIKDALLREGRTVDEAA